MSMLPEGIIPIETGKDGQVLDFVCESGPLLITDYHHLDEEIIAENNIIVKTAGKKNRIEITSIEKLKSALAEFVAASIEILKRHTPYRRPDFSNLKIDLLIEQLVFDVLFDKYADESELMTRNSYSNLMADKRHPDLKDSNRHAFNERLKRGMITYHDRMTYSNLREQLTLLGADPDKYSQYHTPHMKENFNKKKPKLIWDLLYYNFCLDLTNRQYRRQLTRDSRNYPFEEILQDLKVYHNFATKLLPVENESHRKYFCMSMDYYVLESYKRVDFIFKLMDVLSSDEIASIDRNHFLVERFVPRVLVPVIEDGKLRFAWKYKYYRPLLIIEDNLFEVEEEEGVEIYTANYIYYEFLLKKYQYVRAKAYELFKYHCTFSSDDYIEIKKFLRQCYDMRKYHQSNTFWDLIQDTEWKDMDEKIKAQVKERIQHFLSINDAFFWKSADRDYTIPKNE